MAGVSDRERQERPGQAARAPRDTLETAVALLGACVTRQGADLRYTSVVNRAPGLPEALCEGASDLDVFGPETAAHLEDVKRVVMGSGKNAKTEVSLVANGATRWFEILLAGDRDGIVSTIRDMSKEKRTDETMRALLREVSHRSKNLLAIILSIATQTGRHASGIGEFLVRFQGRLQSLAFSQDLITSSNWRGTMLRPLVEAQLDRLWPGKAGRIRYSGLNPWLDPNATLHLGLGLHELVANSARYGALSDERSMVDVVVAIDDEPGFSRRLLFRWSEPLNGPKDGVPTRRFGAMALERIVPASIDGSASLEMRDGALHYVLTIPEGQYSLE